MTSLPRAEVRIYSMARISRLACVVWRLDIPMVDDVRNGNVRAHYKNCTTIVIVMNW